MLPFTIAEKQVNQLKTWCERKYAQTEYLHMTEELYILSLKE